MNKIHVISRYVIRIKKIYVVIQIHFKLNNFRFASMILPGRVKSSSDVFFTYYQIFHPRKTMH